MGSSSGCLQPAKLCSFARLIRSGPKLRACVRNAEATLTLRAHGGLPALIWAYAEDGPARRHWSDVPGSTPASTELAARLKAAGYVFVGPTTTYSLLQACGPVNDHLLACDTRDEVEAERRTVRRP